MIDLLAIGFTETEAAYLKTLHWQMSMHLNCADGNTLNHTIEAVGITRSTYTPKRGHGTKFGYGEFGTPESRFFVAGEKDHFATLADALANVREKHYERITKAMLDSGFKLASVKP